MCAMNPRLLRPLASGFNPKSIAGLSGWWDASDSSTITLNSTTVSEWRDKSGAGVALTQGTAAAQPTYQAAYVNGKNALAFDGGDVLSAATSVTLGDNTVITVVREDAAAGFSGVFSYYPPSGNDNGNANAWLIETRDNTAFLRLQSENYTVDYSGAGTLPLSVITIRRQIAAGDRQTLRTNGVTRGTSASASEGTAAGVLLGGRFQSGAISVQYRSQMTLCEVLSWDRALTLEEYQKIEGYLAWKWGLQAQLPSNHPYAYSFPGFGSQARPDNGDALAWESAVYSNSGSVSVGTLAAVNTFCNAIDAASIRDRFYRLNLFCGDSDASLVAVRVPLYRGTSLGGTQYGNALDTNNNFVQGDYSESVGLTGNATSKYLDTGFSADILPDMAHIGFYKPNTNAPPASDRPIGAYSVISDPDGILGFRSNNSGDFTPEVRGVGAVAQIATTSGGLLVVDRDAETSLTTYDDGTSAATHASDATGDPMPGLNIYVFNQNLDGSPIGTGYYDETIAGYTIGASMSAAQHTAFAAAMTAFQSSLGRTP